MSETLTKAQVSLPSDTEVLVRREFAAPRELVFEAVTTPALMQPRRTPEASRSRPPR